jgi:predicted DNA-binding transcriptional regulator AlpA
MLSDSPQLPGCDNRTIAAFCRISLPESATVYYQTMTPRRLSSQTTRTIDRDVQLSLGIEGPTPATQGTPLGRRPTRNPSSNRAIDVDPIIWMRDLHALLDVHRSTIHRWIKKGIFPAKDAPAGRPTGWLRSTIVRWELGATHNSAKHSRTQIR